MNYDRLQEALADIDQNNHSAEWHGLLCGLICAGRPVNARVWFESAMMLTGGDGAKMSEGIQETLGQLCQRTHQQLDSALVEFELLLPDDEDPLQLRTEGLRMWCDAFLYGLSAGGIDKNVEMSEEVDGFLQDMAELSRAGHDGIDETDKDEFHFLELLEYVRIGVLLLYDELNAGAGHDQPIH